MEFKPLMFMGYGVLGIGYPDEGMMRISLDV
jgi:hypothetical protein